MAQLDANGLRIEYDTFGDPGNEAMLLIMGLGTQMISWPADFCTALADDGHYVVRFDNRDVGLSTKFDGVRAPGRMHYLLHRVLNTKLRVPYTLDDMAADAVGVLDALGIDSAHVVGASMGGMIAQLLAVDYPERVRSLTSFMSTSGNSRLPAARPEITRQIVLNRPKNPQPAAMLEHTMRTAKMISSPGFPRSDEAWRELISASIERSFYPQGFLRQMAAIVADGSRVKRLRRIDAPTLVIHGREDPLVPVECGIDTARNIKGSRLEIIEGMGHDIPPPLIATLTALIAEHTGVASA